MNSKKRFISYLLKERKQIVLIVLSALIFVICQLAQPFIIGLSLDNVISGDKQTFIIQLSICIVLSLLGVVMNYLFETSVAIMTQRVIKQLRDDVFTKINSVSISEIHKRQLGDILQLEIGDIENTSNGIFALFKSVVEGVLTIIITIIMMSMVNWILALGVIVLSPLSFLMSRFVAKFNHKYFAKQAKISAKLNAISLETLSNNDLIQSLNYESLSYEKFKEEDEILRKEGTLAQFSASWINPSTRLVNNTIYAIIGIVGIIMIGYDLSNIYALMSIGKLSSFLSYTNQYSKPFNEISSVLSEYENMKVSFKRINDFLNCDDDVDEGHKSIKDITCIEFKNMDFSYRINQHLIENFNETITKGQKVAIVGPTGAGKTTIINLLMRFYDPNDGSITYNGVNGLDIQKSELRKNFGMVLQETWIFSGTVMDNVRYAKPDATDEEVIEACKKAHADTFIQTLPDGYQTHITSQNGLSEGQKQMLAIARVMLLDNDIVILDEATSNIDTRSEKLINDAFDELMKDRTSIVIAHRLSTIVHADLILVLKDGHIIESGNHQTLMAKKGFYHSMYSSQFK